jgi:type IX secretion system PorP/SprF family membrane protein
MLKFKHIIFFIACFNTICTWGQDPHFSNFNNNKLYYNPAYTGIDYGMRLNFAYRRQWPNIPSKFQTMYACFDQSVRVARGLGGYGFTVISNTEGEGSLQKVTLGIPVSVRIPVAEKSLIQVGAMPSFSFNSINWDKFIFSGQLNPYYGNNNSTGFIPSFTGESNNFYADLLNIGGVFRYENTSSQANSNKFYKKFEVGLSGFHLAEPNQSFTNSKAPLSAKYVLLTSYTTSVSLNSSGMLMLEPSLLCEMQWHMFSYMLGMNTSFVNSNIDFGIWWRSNKINIENMNAIIVLFGYRFLINDNTILTTYLSYDITVSKLNDATRGSPEFTINLAFNHKSFFNDKPDACDEDRRLGIK